MRSVVLEVFKWMEQYDDTHIIKYFLELTTTMDVLLLMMVLCERLIPKEVWNEQRRMILKILNKIQNNYGR